MSAVSAESVEAAIKAAINATAGFQLREYQRQTVEAYLHGKDVFVSAPTGAGKSLTFEMAPFAYEYLFCNNKTMVLVVVPLISLMKNQVTNLIKKGIPAAYVGDDSTEQDMQNILALKARIIFASPEAILNSYRHLLRRLKDNIKAVFIDESHCIAKWGKDGETEQAFRQDYGRVGELRSLLPREVPFVALTATATKETREIIIKELCMQDCVEVLIDPNKENIRYTVGDIDHKNLYETFKPLIDELEEKQINATKVMVFCRRKDHVKELFELFTQCLGPKAYYRPTGEEHIDDRSRLFAMYHKKTHPLVKATVESEFCKENGTVRVVFCTIAFGMGVNVRGGNIVIHLGPSSGLDDYLQETGRVGRNEEPAHAVLLKYKGCTRSRNITQQMKGYINNKAECRRVLLLRSFTTHTHLPSTGALHTCCDICTQRCRCLCQCTSASQEQCLCAQSCTQVDHFQSKFERHLLQLNSTTQPKAAMHETRKKRKLGGDTAKHLRDNLLQYRLQLIGSVTHKQILTGLDLATGFTRSLIDSFVERARDITSLEFLLENFSFLEINHAEYVWQCLCDISEDSSEDDDDDDMQRSDSSGSESSDSECSVSRLRRSQLLLESSEDSE